MAVVELLDEKGALFLAECQEFSADALEGLEGASGGEVA
jgi:hypothetical protein